MTPQAEEAALTDTTADAGPLQMFHLPSLLRAAMSGLFDVMGIAGIREKPDLIAFAKRWLLRHEYEGVRPMLRGLEAFVRRVLLLMAIALEPSAQAKRKAAKPKPATKPAGPLIQTFPFRIFPAIPRARPLRSRVRYEPAEKPTEELWMPPRLRIGWTPRPKPNPHPALSQPGSQAFRRDPPPLKPRVHLRPALGLAVRIEALRRAIVNADTVAGRLRRRLDRHKAHWVRSNTAPPSLLKPFPQDSHGRGLFMLSTLDWLWPGADLAITRIVDTS